MKMPQIPLRTTFLAATVFVAANLLTGYNLFDTKDGTNIICDIDPTCRHLTENEISLAHQYFGDQIDYKKVKYFMRPIFFIDIANKHLHDFTPFGGSQFGNIFAYDSSYKETELTGDPKKEAGFAHEMTHVWQYRNNSFLNFLGNLVKKGITAESAYDYEDDKHLPFYDLSFEQQATIIQNIHYRRQLVHLVTDGNKKEAFCQKLTELEQKAGEELPLTPTPACQNLPRLIN